MSSSIQIRKMAGNDVDLIYGGLVGHDVSKPRDYVERCWRENKSGERTTFLALWDGKFIGWGHLISKPQYHYFLENGIPEIQNFDVIPPYRRRGVGSQLIEAIEQFAFNRYDVIGIGFGLYADYGSAQRLYIKHGYIPDGRGVIYHDAPVAPGSQVCVDDDLVLYLTKSK